ncbi:hypothetical protein T484DRAFT_1945710 [Baffinella frigidus]|nr:hypothetical protein T484DRAFT_1945710 [Cryptophyta sp. CCMP2293]|mmetsp:Transcript_35831/g.81402  ORF Transcript_35831/g.81402 Transcript_35831/m.81402 type:complete len:137 (+) Transcript_35831:15-425(+)
MARTSPPLGCLPGLLLLLGRADASMLPASMLGMSTSDYVAWGIYAVVSLVMLVWVLLNTFPGQILRDSLNKEKAAMYVHYHELSARKDSVYHQMVWARSDGNTAEAKRLELDLEEICAESRAVAQVIGVKRRGRAI